MLKRNTNDNVPVVVEFFPSVQFQLLLLIRSMEKCKSFKLELTIRGGYNDTISHKRVKRKRPMVSTELHTLA
jgi:hypothetical protein